MAVSFLKIPDKPEERRDWIRWQLKTRGITIAAIAREHDVSRQAVAATLRVSNPRWESVIADALQLLPQQLWPERYSSDTHIPLSLTRKSRGR